MNVNRTHYLISYDIREDKSRKNAMELLKNNGYHVQKSVFLVPCDEKRAITLFEKVRLFSNQDQDRVLLLRACCNCLRRRKETGPQLDAIDQVWIV